MRIAKTKRAGQIYCRICGHKFKKDEKYVRLDGTLRVRRSVMCISHFQVKSCYNCPDRLKCLTEDKQKLCILGGDIITKVEEV